MQYANQVPCDVIYAPKSSKYQEDLRIFQGCPTIAVSKGGRVFLGWYAGGTGEPHMHNYNVLVYSDDGGKTWSDPIFVIPSSYEHQIHALDIQLFLDPAGALHVQWVQNNTLRAGDSLPPPPATSLPPVIRDGYAFYDYLHSEWEMICEEPDAEVLQFTEPRYVYSGFLRCKPTFLSNGDWLCFAYDQSNDYYGYSRSSDQGKSYTHHYGGKKLPTGFDETMAYEMRDGRIRLLARTCGIGQLAESLSEDDGKTWSDAVPSGIVSADSRFYVGRLPSGRLLLVTNDCPNNRTNMTVSLSEDDGLTWPIKKCLDTRNGLSYPDVAVRGEEIYLTYDHGRCGANEILYAHFTETDILENREISLSVVSKPHLSFGKKDVLDAIQVHKLIVVLRDIAPDDLIPLVDALYAGGIRLVEIPFPENPKEEEAVANSIRLLAEHYAGKLLVGAGSVRRPEQVRLTKLAGGRFLLSPGTDPAVILEARCCGLVSIPGALTPTEVEQAVSLGADYVKLFPAGCLGPSYLRALRGPLPSVKFIPVGGIDVSCLPDYLAAGACAFGVGGPLVKKDLVSAGNWQAIRRLAEQYCEALS